MRYLNLIIKNSCTDIDWEEVARILVDVEMAPLPSEIRKKSFENSHTVVFVYDNEKLIGIGRAISDGVYEAALYDVAVIPQYQGKGIGNMIVQNIMNHLPDCNFILYAVPGKERFYEKFDFRKMKTGMALFKNIERMQQKGFID